MLASRVRTGDEDRGRGDGRGDQQLRDAVVGLVSARCRDGLHQPYGADDRACGDAIRADLPDPHADPVTVRWSPTTCP